MDWTTSKKIRGLVACLVVAWAALPAGCRFDESDRVTSPPQSTASAPPTQKVIIVVIDGPRLSETFEDPSHQYVPKLWSQLRPLGTLVEEFRNKGRTRTVSGHASILTGTWQVLDNEGLENPALPTLFEYYRLATAAPPSDAVLVGGKAKLAACAYSTDSSYGAAYGAQLNVGYPSDLDTYGQFMTTLQTDKPHLAMLSLSRTDSRGHSGDWAAYVNQIAIADSLIKCLWDYLQSDPFYQAQTTMFVTADHGRHDDDHGGFQAHGDACEGCERLIFLALGPDIRQNHVVSVPRERTQRDICRTVGHVLEIPTPLADGVVMHDIFEATATGIPDTPGARR